MRVSPLVLGLAPLALSVSAWAQGPRLPHPIDPAGIPGTLMIAGGAKLTPDIYDAFRKAAGGADARIVVIPTASRRADAADAETVYLERWRAEPHASVQLLHTRDRAVADSAEFAQALDKATGVWITGGSQKRIIDSYRGTRVERCLVAVLARGGVIGGSSAGAACMSRIMIQGGQEQPDTGIGFDLLPHSIVDQHFSERKREPRLRAALDRHRGRFGVGIDEGTAIEVRGRSVRVRGRGKAHFFVAPGAGRQARTQSYGPGDPIDLISWQRGARERLREPFPPARRRQVRLESGHVMLVGGGRVGRPIAERFVELAGGKDARIAVIPTALGPRGASYRSMNTTLERLGAAEVRTFHVDHPSQVADHDDLEFLQKATGVWFVGGRQWRLVDAYEGTVAFDAFHAVLARGGVVGGSSAGTSIQPEYMVRGNPLGNRDMMALGYERGFGLLPGVAADQHFRQRNRFADMTQVMERHPQILGLGIDEGTAAVFTASTLEILGAGNVALYDWRRRPPKNGEKDYLSLPTGSGYDLETGTPIE
eukprot:jgi/Undpi1/11723/HiC_scaffold_37.g14018.m1